MSLFPCPAMPCYKSLSALFIACATAGFTRQHLGLHNEVALYAQLLKSVDQSPISPEGVVS